MTWTVFLSGEIHTNWREELIEECNQLKLPLEFYSAVTDHQKSDDCGVDILGPEEKSFWKDNKGARINTLRSRVLIEKSDILVVRFGDKYRQWNAAFDAGYASAKTIPVIVQHSQELTHALKEVDAFAYAVTENNHQIAQILSYISAKY